MIRALLAALLLLAAAPALAAAPDQDAQEAQEAQLVNYGGVLISQGDPAGAITRYFDPVIKRYEARYAGVGKTIYAARTPVETLAYLAAAAAAKTDAIVVAPAWGDALFYKGFALVDLARAGEARPLFERAVAMSPQNSRYLAELAQTYQTEKNWSRSLALFRTAASAAETFSPANARSFELGRALRGQGYALTELGRLDEAEAVYKRCLGIDPDDKSAQRELTYIAEQRAARAPR